MHWHMWMGVWTAEECEVNVSLLMLYVKKLLGGGGGGEGGV